MKTYSILFVCMGNICRSPTAHGVFRHRVHQQGWQDWVQVDSAATHNYHPDSPADPRSQEHAAKRGYDMTEFCVTNTSAVVPDPYYGGDHGFEQVLDLVEDACDGLIEHVRRSYPKNDI